MRATVLALKELPACHMQGGECFDAGRTSRADRDVEVNITCEVEPAERQRDAYLGIAIGLRLLP